MNIAEILILKFPSADFQKNIIIQDDGTGPYIKEWNHPSIPVPTDSELAQWKTELQSEYDKQEQDRIFKENNADILAQLEQIDAKSIRALREGNTNRLAELEQQAQTLRGQFK